jgi:two-component system chemotaxis response regulator CheY
MELKTDLKILVVDDMGTMRKIVKNMLSQMGFKHIYEAEDGKKALAIVEDASKLGEPIQFILSDWNMPEMNGLEFVQILKKSDQHKKIPFLMITAEAEQGNVMTAIKAGIDNFVVKPFSAAILKDKIEKIMVKKGLVK